MALNQHMTHASDPNEFDETRLEPFSKQLGALLRREFPDVQLSNRLQWLVARWPSVNPHVNEDLVLDSEPEPSLHWFHGYMYDFPDSIHESVSQAICQFLHRFFAEEIACGVCLEGSKVTSGGPVDIEDSSPNSWWNNSNVTIRSWLGTFDRG